MNYYKTIEPKSCICRICRSEFNQIYDSSHDIEMKPINQQPPKLDKQIILSSLIQALKSNVDELEQENQLLKSSLEFYRNIYYRNIEKLC